VTETLRPTTLAEFGGQPDLVAELEIILSSAAKRQKLPDHMLFAGPPGLGKTTLATIISTELGLPLVVTSGPALEKPAMLAGVLTSLKAPSLLFIDEIHRMPLTVEEILYPAMEDGHMDLTIGEGATARTVRVPVQAFCLVGATTQVGLVSEPLRTRFGFTGRLRLYDDADLARIVSRSAELMGLELSSEAAAMIASRSRGTPRVANKLTQRVRDFAVAGDVDDVDAEVTASALAAFGVDELGLDRTARDLLEALVRNFDGGPVGLNTLSAFIGEAPQTVEEAYEPHLMRAGLLRRTPRGRVATEAAFAHVGATPTAPSQLTLSAFSALDEQGG
jgi:Holliday junction DNA helicase RuvB